MEKLIIQVKVSNIGTTMFTSSAYMNVYIYRKNIVGHPILYILMKNNIKSKFWSFNLNCS